MLAEGGAGRSNCVPRLAFDVDLKNTPSDLYEKDCVTFDDSKMKKNTQDFYHISPSLWGKGKG